MKKVPYVFMRGGTSKAAFFHLKDMPPREHWDAFLLDVMGSPDASQTDGIGGANSLTSKVAIIAPVSGEPFSIDYTFVQVSLTEKAVFYDSNCGNISSAVAPFALEEGLVPPQEGETSVIFRNTNTGKCIEAFIRTTGGTYDPSGDCHIPGVPNPGSPVRLYFLSPEGAVTGRLLPTGNAVDSFDTAQGPLRVSIVDAANPLVFFLAAEAGCSGRELPDEWTAATLSHLEEIRSIAAERCGFAPRGSATALSPAIPKATLISPPQDYVTTAGATVFARDMDICVRMMSMQKPHRAMALSGAICTAAAALTQGTLVASLLAKPLTGVLRIGHPGGIMHVPAEKMPNGQIKAGAVRTARRLADGFVYTRNDHY